MMQFHLAIRVRRRRKDGKREALPLKLTEVQGLESFYEDRQFLKAILPFAGMCSTIEMYHLTIQEFGRFQVE